jgi:hypothetical protein
MFLSIDLIDDCCSHVAKVVLTSCELSARSVSRAGRLEAFPVKALATLKHWVPSLLPAVIKWCSLALASVALSYQAFLNAATLLHTLH